MPYYDKIATQWHQVTGYKGGSFKQHVLNDILLQMFSSIDNRSILELGAGNGYFLPLVLRRFSGQKPSSILITDISVEQLKIAKQLFRVPGANYRALDICRPFPFDDQSFDIILAIMVLNEIPQKGFEDALKECYRTLRNKGMLLIAVTHPKFVDKLQENGQLQRTIENVLTMPGTGSLRLPIIIRPLEIYTNVLAEVGFNFILEDVYATYKVLNERPGLRNMGKTPIALVINCSKSSEPPSN